MNVRAKFQVESVTSYARSDRVTVKLKPVCGDDVEENRRFHKYTPSGELSMTIDNPGAAAEFTPGRYLYVDFTPAE